eukprot:TRINITY_DN9451_c0_g1_i2.p2 TRINITY_DN9451_c0_g1~~TRINITY_DN9451_c0_g1_i2.p2  ORF type:complete len:154 (-),score=21.73 TRINITY_DN9451_c0_g1_i2:1918-2379(-)
MLTYGARFRLHQKAVGYSEDFRKQWYQRRVRGGFFFIRTIDTAAELLRFVKIVSKSKRTLQLVIVENPEDDQALLEFIDQLIEDNDLVTFINRALSLDAHLWGTFQITSEGCWIQRRFSEAVVSTQSTGRFFFYSYNRHSSRAITLCQNRFEI